jgi:quercetin dioxygenase-like cupin family protein
MNVQKMAPHRRLAETLFRWSESRPSDNVSTRAVPLVPGLLVYFLQFQGAGIVPRHSHRGIEGVTVLEGSCTVTFASSAGLPPYLLKAADHEILLYNATIAHEARADETATVLVANFSTKAAQKWNVIHRLYLAGE